VERWQNFGKSDKIDSSHHCRLEYISVDTDLETTGSPRSEPQMHMIGEGRPENVSRARCAHMIYVSTQIEGSETFFRTLDLRFRCQIVYVRPNP
jgi:hypothetical protein